MPRSPLRPTGHARGEHPLEEGGYDEDGLEGGWFDDDPLGEDRLGEDRLDRGESLPQVGRGGLSAVAHRLRSARFEPGLQGAAVLVGVALLAGALSAWFLLGSRPAVVPAPPPSTVVEAPEAGPTGTGPTGTGPEQAGSSEAAPSSPGPPANAEVVVAVAGVVTRPGVVRLPTGSRVVDAVEAAGGVLPGADPGLLNLARVLADGEQVLVGVEPPPGAAATGSPTGGGRSGASAGATTADGRLDLNRAGVAELDALPGVGPVLAQRIVEHRDGIGRFASVEQLGEVPGIGDSRYAELEPLVVVP